MAGYDILHKTGRSCPWSHLSRPVSAEWEVQYLSTGPFSASRLFNTSNFKLHLIPADDKNQSNSIMANSSDNVQLGTSGFPFPITPPKPKPIVIGLYGIQGAGKTHLLNHLKDKLGEDLFSYYDGSDVIQEIVDGKVEGFKKVDGGMDSFKNMSGLEKGHIRGLAIDTIVTRAAESGKIAIVTGHLMFGEEGKKWDVIWTPNDGEAYTHIINLNVDAKFVHEQREEDETGKRERGYLSIDRLHKLQQAELAQLRKICPENNILLAVVSGNPKEDEFYQQVSLLVKDFQHHNEKTNEAKALSKLDEIVQSRQDKLETMLVLDADKTLAAQDTGLMFYDEFEQVNFPLQALFSGPLRYTHNAFRQAMLLYEENANDQEFESLCRSVASKVTMYPEFVALLMAVEKEDHIGAVVVTCGLRQVWEFVLKDNGLSDSVKVIGGSRLEDKIIVTAAVKAAVVKNLRDTRGLYVWAFGDGPLDVRMMRKANQAIVVVGEEGIRSKSMERELRAAIYIDKLLARQVVLPANTPARLDSNKLPVVSLTDESFLKSIVERHPKDKDIDCYFPEELTAKILAAPMRDAKNFGPPLREAHRQVGRYLANRFLPEIIGLEEYAINHVQGAAVTGSRLRNEAKTSIVALMRGGEPMANGVSEAFPLAMFYHAKDPIDFKPEHLFEGGTVVLVDSVINTGKSIWEFVDRVRHLNATIKIVVIAGVVQEKALAKLNSKLVSHDNFLLVALRKSATRFVGSKGTDTGNRLFNTKHLE